MTTVETVLFLFIINNTQVPITPYRIIGKWRAIDIMTLAGSNSRRQPVSLRYHFFRNGSGKVLFYGRTKRFRWKTDGKRMFLYYQGNSGRVVCRPVMVKTKKAALHVMDRWVPNGLLKAVILVPENKSVRKKK